MNRITFLKVTCCLQRFVLTNAKGCIPSWQTRKWWWFASFTHAKQLDTKKTTKLAFDNGELLQEEFSKVARARRRRPRPSPIPYKSHIHTYTHALSHTLAYHIK